MEKTKTSSSKNPPVSSARDRAEAFIRGSYGERGEGKVFQRYVPPCCAGPVGSGRGRDAYRKRHRNIVPRTKKFRKKTGVIFFGNITKAILKGGLESGRTGASGDNRASRPLVK